MFVVWMLAQAVAAASPAPAAPTLQAQFEQGTSALADEKWDEALAGFLAIEARSGLSARTRGVVLLREALALGHLHRDEEARDAYRRGLALVPANDGTLAEDRIEALITLGGLDRGYYDYAAARRDFEQARALATDPTTKLRVLRGLATVTMFDDVEAARKTVDEAMAIAASAKVTPQVDAAIRDMRGRVLLNQGDATAALADLQIAIKDLGGLTERTDLQDATVRSDAALAALKAKQMDKAREYLAMSGEGRLPDGPFAVPADTDVPPCGGDIQPNWSWRASDVKSIPLFFRAVTRVELRCSTAIDRPADTTLLVPALAAWLAGQKVVLPAEGGHDLAYLRAAVERSKGETSLQRLAALFLLAGAPAVEEKEARSALEEALAIAEAQHAPAAARALIRIQLLAVAQKSGRSGVARYRAGLRELLAMPDMEGDPRASGVIRLLLAAPMTGDAPADAAELLQHVANDQRLDLHDPLRVGALVRLASVQAQRGDMGSARQTYLKTGLNAQQCALVDVQPAMRRVGVGSSDYPVDAMRWGMGGWTQIEFDVQPDGRTINRRAVMSYPPFLFGESTVKAMEATRYTQTYRPDGAIGCSGAKQRFRYKMP